MTTIPLYSLLFPLLAAAEWRFARGMSKWKRYQFYALMFGMAYLTVFDAAFSVGFLLVVLGVAMPPHNALFSALHGQPPERKDHWLFEWMQTAAYRLTEKPFSDGITDWHRFGIIYGAVRATWALPGILFLCGYLGSWWPLVGLAFAAEGWVYYRAPTLAKLYEFEAKYHTTLAEFFVGFMVMSYGLACAMIFLGAK